MYHLYIHDTANNDNVRLFKTGAARFQTGISYAYLIIL